MKEGAGLSRLLAGPLRQSPGGGERHGRSGAEGGERAGAPLPAPEGARRDAGDGSVKLLQGRAPAREESEPGPQIAEEGRPEAVPGRRPAEPAVRRTPSWQAPPLAARGGERLPELSPAVPPLPRETRPEVPRPEEPQAPRARVSPPGPDRRPTPEVTETPEPAAAPPPRRAEVGSPRPAEGRSLKPRDEAETDAPAAEANRPVPARPPREARQPVTPPPSGERPARDIPEVEVHSAPRGSRAEPRPSDPVRQPDAVPGAAAPVTAGERQVHGRPSAERDDHRSTVEDGRRPLEARPAAVQSPPVTPVLRPVERPTEPMPPMPPIPPMLPAPAPAAPPPAHPAEAPASVSIRVGTVEIRSRPAAPPRTPPRRPRRHQIDPGLPFAWGW